MPRSWSAATYRRTVRASIEPVGDLPPRRERPPLEELGAARGAGRGRQHDLSQAEIRVDPPYFHASLASFETSTQEAATPRQRAQGTASDFDFWLGSWKVHNRRLRERLADSDEWDEFEASRDRGPILDGLGNEDEFRTD